MADLQFTTDWFSNNIPIWENVLSCFKNQPISALEIGCWEGRSSHWLCSQILTHDSSHLDCIDTFLGGEEHQRNNIDMNQVYVRFQHNLKSYLQSNKVHLHVGLSKSILNQLIFQGKKYHLIYVDGSHLARDTLVDAIFSWMLLSKSGILIFDDYLWQGNPLIINCPKLAIDSFLNCFHGQYEILNLGYQIILRKLVDF